MRHHQTHLTQTHLFLIRLIGVIVPRGLRADWRQEWEAELRYRETLLAEWDKLNWQNKLDLLRRSVGAFRDALLLQPRRLEDEMFQDLRYGVRMLLKQPGFALVAVLSLALGIGANTAIFSLLDVVLLKSLPVQQPDQLVLFGKAEDGGLTNRFPNRSWDLFSYPFYQEVRQRNEVFTEVGALLSMPWTVHGTINNGQTNSELRQFQAQLVSGTYFPTLGINAALGRCFTAEDDQTPGGHPVAMVSYAWWERNLGGDPAAVGKTLTIDQTTYTIIGVTPREFFGTTVGQAPDLWVPLAMEPQLPPAHWNGRTDKEHHSLYLIGRLKDGVSSQQASVAVNLLFKQSLQELAGAQASPERLREIQQASIELTPAGKGLAGLRNQFSLSLKILMAVVGLVLLIACANVANLLLARAANRQKEFAVRLALGAGRFRLLRQLLTESVLLASLGGLLGIALAWSGSRLLLVWASNGPDPLPLDVSPNLRILGFTLVASLLSALIFGTAPALRAMRLQPNSALKGGRGTVQTGQSPFGKALVVAQVALSLLLLVGAGLFVRTLINLQSIPAGFNSQNALLFKLDITTTGYKDEQLPQLMQKVEERVKQVPGVQAASFSFFVFGGGQWSSPIYTREQTIAEGQSRSVKQNVVGTDYFTAMGIPLVAGRVFGPQDTQQAPKVTIISEALARRFFPNGSALGKRFSKNADFRDELEVIGVVKDAKYGSLTEELRPMAYYPHGQRPDPLDNFVVRFSGTPESVIPQIRQAISQVNQNLPIDNVTPLSVHVGRTLAQQQLVARLATFFGLLALLLACIGLYGVLSYGVARRTNEIGIRMALGAHSGNVLWLIMREALVLVFAGVLLGLISAVFATKLAESLLFNLKPTDPLTLASAALLLTLVAALAGYLPARKAARVDPMVALRDE